MSAVRSGEVVEALPLGQFRFQIDVALVGEQLVELLAVGPVRSLDLSVEVRRARLDVGVADALVLDMPVEPGLELVAVARWEGIAGDRLWPPAEPLR